MAKYSTRMHEVYDTRYCLVIYCGSQSACKRFVMNSPRKWLAVRPAGR